MEKKQTTSSDPNNSARKKRSISDDDLWAFLQDMYPGVLEKPTDMVRMLASPVISPDKKIDSTALFHKQANDRCKLSESKCPEDFFQLNNVDKCIYDPKTEMTIDEAISYSSTLANGNAQLFQFGTIETSKELLDYVKSG